MRASPDELFTRCTQRGTTVAREARVVMALLSD